MFDMYNTKIKHYPDHSTMSVASRCLYKDPNSPTVPREWRRGEKHNTDDPRDDSSHRAKTTVFDIAALNDFDYFVTWTIDPKQIDSKDAAIVSKKLRSFLNNMRARYNMSYVVIPERHIKGGIHLHGLIRGDIQLVDSGHKTKAGQTIYNMPQWKFGFSTAIPLYGDKQNVAKYITKYISKDFQKIFGNFYYAGGDIKRHPDFDICDVDFESVVAKEVYIKKLAVSMKYKDIEV